jgi:threonine dehydrogenase-like Zn-dependent dehydrogenase
VVKAYNRHLRDLIHHDPATPSIIVSHELPLDDAFRHFDAHEDGWTKVVASWADQRASRADRCGTRQGENDR